jgi:hypothetical protein
MKEKSRFSFIEGSLKRQDIHRKGRQLTDPAIKDIFNRLALKGIEDAMKFEFKTERETQCFKQACICHRNYHKIHAHVGYSGNTVYIYNLPKED